MSARAVLSSVLLASLLAATVPVAAAESELAILTYPIGLVTGEIPITADLGSSNAPAELYLDGNAVCSLSATSPSCSVDLGADPRVHLLELIRRSANGRGTEVARRWLNRPGQEAELALRFGPPGDAGRCTGSLVWSHPDKLDPVSLQLSDNGGPVEAVGDGHSFRFDCADPSVPHVVAAAAIFADGRRAEEVTLAGGRGGAAESSLTAIPVEWAGAGEASCDTVKTTLSGVAQAVQRAGYEVVFVLDPSAGYQTLQSTGWNASALPSTTSTTKTFDSLVLQGSKGSEPTPKASWKRADASLIGAERLWFVAPDDNLGRINGFGNGRPNWLRLLFQFGSTKLEGKPRLADAVAASGLVAAAGPRPRAVALILGSKAERDVSDFTPAQARSYLAEVGVPLIVLRNGRRSDDGWPEGVPVHNMEAMADALESLQARLERQCVAWFTGSIHPNRIAALLPDEVAIAGRLGDAPSDVEAVWRQAELALESYEEPPHAGTGQQVEVTAVTLLVAAKDDAGRPATDLEAADLAVFEDGRQVPVLGVARAVLTPPPRVVTGAEPAAAPPATPEPPAQELPVTIYVDRKLSGANEIGPPLRALAERAAWLASLGPVDIVVADRAVEATLTAARDPAAISAGLEDLAAQVSGRHAIEQLRSRFVRDLRKIPNRFPRSPRGEEDGEGSEDPTRRLVDALEQGQGGPTFERSIALTAARGAIAEEDALLRLTQERLRDWALESPVPRPRLMLVVGAGFDQDPVESYVPFIERLETELAGTAREEFKRFRQSERISGLGRTMASAGWLVVAVATTSASGSMMAADQHGGDRFQAFLSMAPEAVRTASSEWLLLDPISTQRRLAAPSGGDVVIGGNGLDALAAASAGWYRVSYQVDRAPDGIQHALEVRADRAGVQLSAPEVIATETGDEQAALRVRRVLREPARATAELAVAVAIGPLQAVGEDRLAAEATVSTDLATLAPFLTADSRRVVRVSVAVDTGAGDAFVLHRLATIEGQPPGWSYVVPLEWPRGATATAVVVEDLGSGAWGGAVTELPAVAP